MGEAEDLAEAEAGALADRLGGEERLERAFPDFLGHAAAGVGDRKLEIFAGLDVADGIGGHGHILGGDRQAAVAVHRVAGVDREIEDRIFELVRIDEHRPGFGVEPGLDLDPLAQRAVEQVGHAG